MKKRSLVMEVVILIACAAALAGALLVMFRTDGGSWTDAVGDPGTDSTTDPSLRSSFASDGKGGSRTDSPVQIHIRSPEAAPAITNDATGPLFIEHDMKPGSTSTRCVAVSNAGVQLANVHMYSTVVDRGLARFVSFVIEAGKGGANGDCAGFKGKEVFRGTLAELAAGHRNFASGLPAPADVYPREAVSFRLTQGLLPGSPQAATATVKFGWEARGAGAPSPLRGQDPIAHQPAGAAAAAPHAVGRSVAQVILEALGEILKRGWSWMALALLVGLFLVIQDRIDRRDPRLAGALVHPEPEVPFSDRIGRSTRTSEANA